MQVIPGDVIIEPAGNRPAPKSQPIEALSTLDPQLDEAQVRQAISTAVENNQDPQSITMQDFAQVPKTPVPDKFMKTDGTVDVDKIQASTKQLDEGIQKKEEAIKTVDDYMREYNEKQAKFSGLPNAQKTLAQIPQNPPAQPLPQGDMTPQQMEEIVRRDYQADPLGTTTRLLDLMLQAKFQPIEQRERIEATRSNIQRLAERDPRILQSDVFDAVNAKLQNDPDLWKLKNPHKAAWLEVKEEMRLGDPSPNGNGQAQPSRPSPVLGGGSPPSVPSSSVQSSGPVNLSALDIRDKKQEALGDEAVRAMLQNNRG